jgi:hypothetical protein
MRRLNLAALLALGIAASLEAGVAIGGIDAPTASAQAFQNANDAWSRGDYIAALAEYIRLVKGPAAPGATGMPGMNAGADYFDAIALQTGELYQSSELTSDGRNPTFSPDERFIAYETGLEVSRRTRIVRNDASLTQVADLPGVSAAFSSASGSVAYFRIAESADIRAAAQAVERAALTAENRGRLVQTLAWHVLRNSTIVVHDLNTGGERELPAPGLLKTGLAYAADGRTLYFLGRPEIEEGSNDIYAIAATGEASQPTIVGGASRLKGAPIVDPSGQALLYVVPAQDPLRRPASQGSPGSPGSQGSRSASTTAVAPTAAAAAPVPPSFGVVDLASGKTTIVEGAAPRLSADGRTLAYIARTATETQLMIGPTLGPATAARKTTGRLDAPALSADGSRVAYQLMTRDDWDIYVADRDGRNDTRLTRDVQHDLLPQFLAGDRVLEVIGEPRHRRSFLLDLKTGAQTRLFHNNTVRTISPEYQWVVSKDGTKILIGAERDGNTVSPERGVYLMDLSRKISRSALLERLESSLAGERALRESQTKAFGPIAATVREVVNHVSVDRIYAYEKALFDFDSKHISMPGNTRASEFLFNTYRSFGYEPQYQWFEPQGALGGRTANVIARLPGTVNPELTYVVSSHYDSVTVGPGADDDSSGTAALVEAARVLAGHPQPATIIFASFTGEEAGLLGSREFVRRAVADKLHVAGALNNDMVGWTNDARLDNTIRYSNPGIRDIQHGAAMLFTRLITYDALYFKGTDAASYYDAYGDIVGGIGSYPVLSSPHYHQSHDLLEFENHDLIAETSKTTVATLMRLASSPSRLKHLKVDAYAGGAATVSWDASPEKGVSAYVVSISAPAAAARSVTVTAPRATLRGVAHGSVVSVKAVNARGLESWDVAKVTVGGPTQPVR